jgi:hypothetical protein
MRRFPPPWSVDELDACFVVTDGAGQKLAYVNFEDELGGVNWIAAFRNTIRLQGRWKDCIAQP